MNWLLNLLAANFRRNCLAVKGPNTIAGWWGNEGDGSGPDLAVLGKGRYLLNVAFLDGGLHVAGGGEVLRRGSRN